MLGERLTFEYKSEAGQPLDIVDYDYLPVSNFVELVGGRDVESSHVLMTLLSDNSVVISSIETGVHLLWFDLDLSSLDIDD